METELTLSLIEGGGGLIPPHAARNCTQDLKPIALQEWKRNLRGELVPVYSDAPLKYSSCIKGKDLAPFAAEQLKRGVGLWVGCVQRLTFPLKDQTTTLSRIPVSGSLAVFKGNGEKIEGFEFKGQTLSLTEEAPSGSFISYRPLLKMCLMDFHLETDEWGLTVGWKMQLEEF